ncbi:MAG: adenylosuccinate lyase [Kyrpidia sp.]|nr:adenylosuccinate lyase [Kyrpidia sp.]
MIPRYALPEMAAIWTDENKFRMWLEVELLACEAWAELGVIPWEDVRALRANARFDVERIAAIERETRHDVVAFTRAVSESLGPERKWVHYGLTSTDVVDTALSALLKQANERILVEVHTLIETLAQLAKKYKYTVMMGRTHGVHAEPTTFGLKAALWYAEMQRNLRRLEDAAEQVRVGKISGAVGTYANIDPFVEAYVCRNLGLEPAPISTQTLQRDRHAHYMAMIALTAATLDKIATEIRGLQKTEVREVEEPFYKGQKGSSAMPHKRNPVSCEQISGLARVLRGYVVPALEDVPLWHERDISHSSVERVILPDAATLIHYLLRKMTGILRDLTVFPDNMKRNMEKTFGLIYSQRVLLALIDKGASREKAYDAVQARAMQAWEERRSFRELIEADPWISEQLTREEVDDCFDPRWHLKHVDTIFARLGLDGDTGPETGGREII